MPVEDPDAPLVHTARGILKWFGTIAGSLVGIGALAFSCGFLAQRAQYDFLQVPFVFIDYWAYAETGIMAVVRSLYLLMAMPFCVGLIAVASIAIILALESEHFRRRILRPHWTFLVNLALILILGIILDQQLRVRALRGNSSDLATDVDGRVPEAVQDTIPATFIFSVGDPVRPPVVSDLDLPRNAFVLWEKIADDLSETLGRGALYLDAPPGRLGHWYRGTPDLMVQITFSAYQ